MTTHQHGSGPARFATVPGLLAAALSLPFTGGGANGSPVEPFLAATGEAVSNLDGGLEHGTVFLGLIDYGAGFDLGRLAGWGDGWSAHLQAQWLLGEDPSENLMGDFNALSNIAAFETHRLFQAWVRKESADGAAAVKAGLLALDDDFMASDYSALFINSGFGPLPTQSGNNPAPIWPVGAPGVHLSWERPGGTVYQLGLYDGDAGSEEANSDGLRVRLDNGGGAMIMAEVAVPTSLGGRETTVKAGGFYHSGTFEDFGDGGTADGQYGFYGIGDIALGNGWGAFWRAGFNPQSDRNAVRAYTDFGFNRAGPFASRPDDVLGLGALYTDFAADYLDANPGSREGEAALELTYAAPLAEHLTVQPSLQWILNPHEGAAGDALVFVLRGELVF